MERILDEDERIRRAEEIYLKRNNRNISLLQNSENKSKRYWGSKVLLHLLVLFNIAVVIFCLQNKDYIFTQEFLSECDQYNINISEKMNQLIKNFLMEDIPSENSKNIVENITNETSVKANVVTESQIQEHTDKKTYKTEENASIATLENKTKNTESSSLSEMDLDVQNLKQIYKFVKPLDAKVSSEFGARESEYQNVRGYHTGIDLAAEKGTSIKAAMQGIVELVSSEGDYRKTCKN